MIVDRKKLSGTGISEAHAKPFLDQIDQMFSSLDALKSQPEGILNYPLDTTDDTQTTIFSKEIPLSSILHFRAVICGYAGESRVRYVREFTTFRGSGTPVIDDNGTILVPAPDIDVPGWGVQIVIIGVMLEIKVTGGPSTPVHWIASVDVTP